MFGRLRLVVLPLLACAVLLVGCAGTSGPKSVAGQLYVGDNPDNPDITNPTVSDLAPYREVLAKIRLSCTNSERTLGNWAVADLDMIAKNTGTSLTSLFVLQAVAAAEAGQSPHGCKGDFAIVGVALQGRINNG
jgi:hypothetical protein